MGDKVLSAKVKEGTELYSRFQEHAEEYQTQSEAVRAAMRAGLEADDDSGDLSPPETAEGGGGGLGISTIFGLTAAFGSAVGPALIMMGLLLVLTFGQAGGLVATVALALSEGLVASGMLLFAAALVALGVGWRGDRTAEDAPAPTEEGADA
jgi:hypothetical protein